MQKTSLYRIVAAVISILIMIFSIAVTYITIVFAARLPEAWQFQGYSGEMIVYIFFTVVSFPTALLFFVWFGGMFYLHKKKNAKSQKK